jgi:hypothetical protein
MSSSSPSFPSNNCIEQTVQLKLFAQTVQKQLKASVSFINRHNEVAKT